MISLKLRVAGSTGSFRIGAVVRKLTVWPAGFRTLMTPFFLPPDSSSRGGNVNGGMPTLH